MADEEPTIEVMPDDKDEAPIWPNVDGVPLEEKRRAWCVATAMEAVIISGKLPDTAHAVVEAASIVEHYLDTGKVKRRPLSVVE